MLDNKVTSPRSIASKFFTATEVARARRYINKDCEIDWFGKKLTGHYALEQNWKDEMLKQIKNRNIEWQDWERNGEDRAKRVGTLDKDGENCNYTQEVYAKEGQILKLSYNSE